MHAHIRIHYVGWADFRFGSRKKKRICKRADKISILSRDLGDGAFCHARKPDCNKYSQFLFAPSVQTPLYEVEPMFFGAQRHSNPEQRQYSHRSYSKIAPRLAEMSRKTFYCIFVEPKTCKKRAGRMRLNIELAGFSQFELT